MRTRTHTQPAQCIEYINDDGAIIGATIAVRRLGRTLFLAEAHDWETEEAGYQPLVIDVYDDIKMAQNEIERRARQYQAPSTLG